MLNLFVNKSSTRNRVGVIAHNNNNNTQVRQGTNIGNSPNTKSRFSVHMYNLRQGVSHSRRLQDLSVSSPQELANLARKLIKSEVDRKFHPTESSTLVIGAMKQIAVNMFLLRFTIYNATLNCTDTYEVQLGKY